MITSEFRDRFFLPFKFLFKDSHVLDGRAFPEIFLKFARVCAIEFL